MIQTNEIIKASDLLNNVDYHDGIIAYRNINLPFKKHIKYSPYLGIFNDDKTTEPVKLAAEFILDITSPDINTSANYSIILSGTLQYYNIISLYDDSIFPNNYQIIPSTELEFKEIKAKNIGEGTFYEYYYWFPSYGFKATTNEEAWKVFYKIPGNGRAIFDGEISIEKVTT